MQNNNQNPNFNKAAIRPQSTNPNHNKTNYDSVSPQPNKSNFNKNNNPRPNQNGGAPKFGNSNKRTRKITQPKFESRMGIVGESSNVPDLIDGNVRIIHLGGVEEIGRNMSCIEYKDSIILVDCGIQFSEASTPGIDFILPNTKYVEERKHKIKAMLITHGHLDHIGAIPYIMPRIDNPPIYSRNFTTLMIQKRQEEFPFLAPLKINVVEAEQVVDFGDLKVRFFAVNHAIPDSMGIIIETPYGDIVHTGDLRVDHVDGVPKQVEEENYEFFKDRKVLCLMTDSTNVEQPGFSMSDAIVYSNIDRIIRDTKGRLIVSTFASQVERMLFMLETCERYGRKVVVEGRSMKTNIEVAKYAEMLKIKPETLIALEEMENYPPNKLVVLATGAQGEEFAALGRIANKTHKYIKLNKFDTILMSSSVVPGNERAVQNLKDKLSRQGAHLIHYKTSDVHSSGHANYEELMWLHNKINAKFFIPVHGYHYMLRVHADLERARGTSEDNIIIPDNGKVIEIQDNGNKIVELKEKAPNEMLIVDGNNVGKIQEVVLRDRITLGEEGFFGIIAIIDNHTHRLRKSPDIISRGFVYLKESQDLLYGARNVIKSTIDNYLDKNERIDIDTLRNEMQDVMAKFLIQKTAKKPVITPVIITI
jgi:ribonuclease J